jgi:signal transduction histidine kinase
MPDPKAPAFAQVEVAYRAAVIAPELIAGYFDQFYQRDTAANAAHDSGLGLAISKLLIQAHGGAISVSSNARSGTQVKFTLPLEGEQR